MSDTCSINTSAGSPGPSLQQLQLSQFALTESGRKQGWCHVRCFLQAVMHAIALPFALFYTLLLPRCQVQAVQRLVGGMSTIPGRVAGVQLMVDGSEQISRHPT